MSLLPRRRGAYKLTPELQERLTSFLRAGNYIDVAVRCVGIHKDTFFEWLKVARETGEEPFASFADAVDKAVAESEARDVALIGKAATDVWQAAAWRLERKHPARWGRRERHEVTGADGAPIEVKAGIVVLPPEDDAKP